MGCSRLIVELENTARQIHHTCPHYTRQHLLFLSVCVSLKSDVCVTTVSHTYPHGDMIGVGDSVWINTVLSYSKIFRTHAAFHDAYGFMKTHYDIGPGYCYNIGSFMGWKTSNNCLLGHITGLSYWLLVRLFRANIFYSIPV